VLESLMSTDQKELLFVMGVAALLMLITAAITWRML
jgi:hypothetical protein